MKSRLVHTASTLLGAAVTLFAVALASAAWTPGAQTGPSVGPKRVCYAFETIAQGSQSGFGNYCGQPLQTPPPATSVVPPCYANVAQPEFEAVIRNECAWADVWAAHGSNSFPPPPLPAVDFDRHVVVAVVSGSRPNGCYGMEITHVTSGPGGVGRSIHVRERIPCPGDACTLAITNNFHFIKVCKEFLPFKAAICFEHQRQNIVCSTGVDCITPGTGGG